MINKNNIKKVKKNLNKFNNFFFRKTVPSAATEASSCQRRTTKRSADFCHGTTAPARTSTRASATASRARPASSTRLTGNGIPSSSIRRNCANSPPSNTNTTSTSKACTVINTPPNTFLITVRMTDIRSKNDCNFDEIKFPVCS